MSNRGSCMMHPETRMEGSEKGKHREGLFLSVPLLSFPEVRPCRGLASRSRCQGPRGQGQASCLLHLCQAGGVFRVVSAGKFRSDCKLCSSALSFAIEEDICLTQKH